MYEKSGWKQVSQDELFGRTCYFCDGDLDHCNWTYDGMFLCWKHSKALTRVLLGLMCSFCSKIFLQDELKRFGDVSVCEKCWEKVESLLNESPPN